VACLCRISLSLDCGYLPFEVRYVGGEQVEDAGCSAGSVVAADDVPRHHVIAAAVVAEDASRFELRHHRAPVGGWSRASAGGSQ
jgi:hypothetical protein